MPIDTPEARAALPKWERVAEGGLFRVACPGGWIYCSMPSDLGFPQDGDPISFVPAPAENSAARTELPAALRRIDALEAALVDILDYRGGADSALDDEYVVGRARAALAASKGGV